MGLDQKSRAIQVDEYSHTNVRRGGSPFGGHTYMHRRRLPASALPLLPCTPPLLHTPSIRPTRMFLAHTHRERAHTRARAHTHTHAHTPLPPQVPSIWAIGDCTNRMNLTPVALMEGKALVATLFGGKPSVPDYENVRPAAACRGRLLPAASCRGRLRACCGGLLGTRWPAAGHVQAGQPSAGQHCCGGICGAACSGRRAAAATLSAGRLTLASCSPCRTPLRRCPPPSSASRRWARWA